MSEPLVSIVTPTIVGREQQLYRAVWSILNLDWPTLNLVVVSDRTIEPLEDEIEGLWQDWRYADRPRRLDSLDQTRFFKVTQINESWRTPHAEASIGAVPFAVGSLLALGKFVGYCGDDDELLPDHVSRHVAAMREAQAMFSISAVDFRVDGVHQFVVGPGFEHGHLDAIGIMCHVDALKVATWTANGENAADYRLVRDWRAAGLRGVLVDGPPTAIHHDGWPVGRSGRPDRPGGGY